MYLPKAAFAAFSISDICRLSAVLHLAIVIPLLTNKEKTV
ncbi:hypothetical protein CUC51_02640 [Citrobacter freundii]|nr:hypothetical protein AM350_01325 [Citrobacter freundii]AYL69704.1 hypothetical protein CUC51_02640 [Citrobacter freundii]